MPAAGENFEIWEKSAAKNTKFYDFFMNCSLFYTFFMKKMKVFKYYDILWFFMKWQPCSSKKERKAGLLNFFEKKYELNITKDIFLTASWNFPVFPPAKKKHVQKYKYKRRRKKYHWAKHLYIQGIKIKKKIQNLFY